MSDRAQRVVTRAREPALSDLVEVELFAALARKTREGAMRASDARRVGALFTGHLEEGYYTRLALERTHYRVARDWMRGLEVHLRTLDALHLAIAHAGGLRLITADAALARAATRVGVQASLLRMVAKSHK